MDLSRRVNESVKSFIDSNEYAFAFPSVDDAVRMLTTLGVGAFV